jgi:integrase
MAPFDAASMRTRIWVTVLSNNGRLPILVDEDLQPLHLPLRYVVDRLYFDEAWRSIENRLKAIGYLYRYFYSRGIDVDEQFLEGSVLRLDDLRSFFAWLELKDRENPELNSAKAEQLAKETFNNYVSYTGDYVAWVARHFGSRHEKGARRGLQAAKEAIAIRRSILDFKQAGKSKKRFVGLRPEQEKILLETVRPGSPTNPFQSANQFPYGVLVRQLLEAGIRAGELMYLQISDIELWGSNPEIRVEARSDFGRETRRRAPSAKTLDRILPISKNLAKDLSSYERKVRGSVAHPYFFVTPRGRQPIGERNIARIYMTPPQDRKSSLRFNISSLIQ